MFDPFDLKRCGKVLARQPLDANRQKLQSQRLEPEALVAVFPPDEQHHQETFEQPALQKD